MSEREYRLIQQIVDADFESRLRLLKSTQDIYLDGKLFDLAEFRDEVFQEWDVLLRNDKHIYERIYLAAKKHPFSPVQDYLEEVTSKHPDIDYQEVFRHLNEKVLHIDPDSLEANYLVKALVAAVKRVYEPGSQHQSVLILKGKQGFYKTSFFRELAGYDNFQSITLSSLGKDEIMILHSKWITELEEIEGSIKPSKMSTLKGFISRWEDPIRKPYAKKEVLLQRQFILVGTTNQDEFLVDDTGNRRFWVIDLKEKIDIDWVRENRDFIWAAAVKAYRGGYQTHLNQEEEALSEELNRKKYQVEDPWEDVVTDWVLSRKEPFTLTDILTQALGKSSGAMSRNDADRVKKILKKMGLEVPKLARRVPGKKDPGKYIDPIVVTNLSLAA